MIRDSYLPAITHRHWERASGGWLHELLPNSIVVAHLLFDRAGTPGVQVAPDE